MKFDEEKMIKNIAEKTGISEEMINEAFAYYESKQFEIEAAMSTAHDRSQALERMCEILARGKRREIPVSYSDKEAYTEMMDECYRRACEEVEV